MGRATGRAVDYEAFEKALLQALKPLVRLAVKRGVEFHPFAELLKNAFVEVVEEDFRVPGRRPTISRIAVLTGLTRREASRLVTERQSQKAESPRKKFNRAARVFDAWSTDPRYQDRRGRPASLPIEAESGASFSELVRRHGSDVPPRAVLDELMRVGAVARLRDGRVRPVERGYIPSLDETEKLAILGSDVGDLIATIDHNLTPESGEPFFQRKVAYDNLPADYLPALRKLVRKDAQALLEKLSADMSKQDRDVIRSSEAGEAEDRHRAMVGIYYFEEPCDEAE